MRPAAETAPALAARPDLRALIEQVFALDPRPARHRRTRPRSDYAVRLWGFDVHGRIDDDGWCITRIDAPA